MRLFATAVAGPADAEHLIAEVLRIIEARFRSYPWSGNVRELKGCVSNVHEQREYEPPSGYEPPSATPRAPSAPPAAPAPGADLARAVLEGTIDAAELRRFYILHVFALAGS